MNVLKLGSRNYALLNDTFNLKLNSKMFLRKQIFVKLETLIQVPMFCANPFARYFEQLFMCFAKK